MLFCAAALAGCADNDGVQTATGTKNRISLTAGIDTRTANPDAPVWTEGDAIGVHFVAGDAIAVNNQRLEGTLEDGGLKATFSGDVTLAEGDYTIYGYYPHGTIGTTANHTEAKIDIPATQHPTNASFDSDADIMVMWPVAHSHDGVAAITHDGLQFKRVLGMVKFVLDSAGLNGEAIRKLTFTTDDPALNLAGKGHFDLTDGAFKGFYEGAVTSVTAEPAGDVFANGTDAIMFCVPAMTIGTNVTMTIEGETDGFTFTKSVLVGDVQGTPVEVTAGGYHTMNVALAASDIRSKGIPAPTGLSCFRLSTTSVMLSWEHADADKHEIMIGDAAAVEVAGLSYTAENLTPETEYTWKVRSFKNGTWSEWTEGSAFKAATLYSTFPYFWSAQDYGPHPHWPNAHGLDMQLMSFSPDTGPWPDGGYFLVCDILSVPVDNSPGIEFLSIPAGRYEFNDSKNAANMFSGSLGQYIDYGYNSLTITGGAMIVAGDRTDYTILIDLTFDDGRTFAGSFNGPFDISNQNFGGQ
jgi:hypothetical protein